MTHARCYPERMAYETQYRIPRSGLFGKARETIKPLLKRVGGAGLYGAVTEKYHWAMVFLNYALMRNRTLNQTGEEVQVFRNDRITLEEIEALNPARLVISPGPCSPEEAGISVAAIRHFAGKIPILGVCLGNQILRSPPAGTPTSLRTGIAA